MFYILSLILVLGLVFSTISGTNVMGGLWDQITRKISGFDFPRTQKEIVIENIESQYSELDKFFSVSAPSLLNSENISPQDKESLKKAVQIFEESQNTIEQLKNTKKDGKSVTKAIVEKVFNFNSEKEEKSVAQTLIKNVFDLDTEPNPEPLNIPPNCNLVCAK